MGHREERLLVKEGKSILTTYLRCSQVGFLGETG